MYDWELNDDTLKTWVRLRQASEAMERVLGAGLDEHDATLAQIDVLGVLSASKVLLRPGTIGSYTFRQQHSVSAQLGRMRKAGLITKTRGKEDERAVTVKITPKGKERLEQTREAGLGQARKLLKAALSDEEIKQLDGLLKKVRDQALQRLGTKAERLPDSLDVSRFEAKLT